MHIYIYIDIKEKNKQSFFIFSCPGFSSTRLPVFLRSWALGSHWSPPSGIGCCDCWGSVIHTSWKYRASLWVFLHVFMHVKRNLGRSPCDWIEWIEYMYNHVYIYIYKLLCIYIYSIDIHIYIYITIIKHRIRICISIYIYTHICTCLYTVFLYIYVCVCVGD